MKSKEWPKIIYRGDYLSYGEKNYRLGETIIFKDEEEIRSFLKTGSKQVRIRFPQETVEVGGMKITLLSEVKDYLVRK